MHPIRPVASFVVLALLLAGSASAAPPKPQTFVFGDRANARGAQAVRTVQPYASALGHGVENSAPRLDARSLGGSPFFFSFDAPEGNYRVTVTLGGDRASETTVKAELRRLMLGPVKVAAGGSARRSFIVNVRTPQMPDGRQVRLKAPRESTEEARAWDGRITLEFDGANPQVRAIQVEAVAVPTVYILGDSTSTDQAGEPYASWGQMLPVLFKPTIAIANHGESGESVSASIARGRFDKILSLVRPGDYFIVQFGHNDMKEKPTDPAAPQKYKAGLIDWARRIQAKGATPIIVTPVNRHTFENGKVANSLEEYPALAREAAAETGAVLIDLNLQSKSLYEAFGETPSLALFEHNADFSQVDGTHHSQFGAYELARIIVEGLRAARLPLARQLVDGLPRFDPARPDREADFRIPPSIGFAAATPLGS